MPTTTAARFIEYFDSMIGLLLISATPTLSCLAVSALVKRFMAAMINTSSSVKPPSCDLPHERLAIRSVASPTKAKAVPNLAAHVTIGERNG
jgi:hypothetical protein